MNNAIGKKGEGEGTEEMGVLARSEKYVNRGRGRRLRHL